MKQPVQHQWLVRMLLFAKIQIYISYLHISKLKGVYQTVWIHQSQGFPRKA